MSDIEKVKQLRKSTGAGFKDCNSALKESLQLIKKNKKNLVIAYEPVWAIGTGRSANIRDIETTHNLIRKLLFIQTNLISRYKNHQTMQK